MGSKIKNKSSADCFSWLNTGSCSYGHRCNFAHKSDTRNTGRGRPTPKKKQVSVKPPPLSSDEDEEDEEEEEDRKEVRAAKKPKKKFKGGAAKRNETDDACLQGSVLAHVKVLRCMQANAVEGGNGPKMSMMKSPPVAEVLSLCPRGLRECVRLSCLLCRRSEGFSLCP